MQKAFPLLLAGGAAALILSGKKKPKKKSKTTDSGSLPSIDELPDEKPPRVIDEDMDEEDSSPSPDPSPVVPVIPKPDPSPTPVTPDDVPSKKPAIGPSAVGTCVNQVYTRDPEYIAGDLDISQKGYNLFGEAGYYFYIRRSLQEKLYNYMLARLKDMKNGAERRTVASVVLREALKHFNSGCKWEGSISSLSEPEKLVWSGGQRLAIIAQTTAGIVDPSYDDLFRTGNRLSITRDSLGDPDPGFFGAQTKPVPGTRVEVLVTDETQENAEHIIGEVVKLSGPNGENDKFEIKFISTFQGANVTPNLTSKHGFKVGSNAYFSQKSPTGIYRIFPKDMK